MFNVIIGNPPYQRNDGGGLGTSAVPLYHLFVERAISLNPDYITLITPSRWFAGGRGLDDFRDRMLNDRRLKELHDFPDASEVFDNVEIKGGVSYFLWDKSYSGDCVVKTFVKGSCKSSLKRPLLEEGSDVFIRDNESISILKKIQSFGEKSFSDLVSSRNPFGLESKFKGDEGASEVMVYATKTIGFTSYDRVPKNKELIDKHKVLIPKAIGSGDSRTDKVNPVYAACGTCCTDTYLLIGCFDTKQQCENVISYINSKFFHFCLSLIKNTQNTSKRTYLFIPQQDFNKSWNDKELCSKYNLTEGEIEYIENNIQIKVK